MNKRTINQLVNLVAMVGILFLVLAFRVLGPSDLDLKDQPKTVSYTLDIVENGRWAWPHDMLGRPATKPPFYNWIGAGIVYLTGMPNEFILKAPTLIAAAVIFVGMYFFFHYIIPNTSEKEEATAFLSMLIFTSSVSVFVLIYVVRPDMMLACWLFIGWCCAIGLIVDNTAIQNHQKTLKLILWISFSAALLTKGPPAVLLPLYILLIGICQSRFKDIARRCSFVSGFSFALIPVVIWLLFAMDTESEYILGPLVTSEIERVASGLSLSDRIRDLYKMPYYFLVRFMPWTPFLIYFYFRFKDQVTKNSWVGYAFIWIVWVIVFFSFPTFKRDDYLLPAFPVAATLTAFFISRIEAGWFRGFVVATAYAAVLITGSNNVFFKKHRMTRYGDHVKQFASVIREHVPDTRKLVFYDTGYNPLQSYLRRNQAAIKPEPVAFAQAEWLVAPVDASYRPDASIYPYVRLEKIAESGLILHVAQKHADRLALFRIVRQ